MSLTEENLLAQLASAKSFKSARLAKIEGMIKDQRCELERLEAVALHWQTNAPDQVLDAMAEKEAYARQESNALSKKRTNEEDAARAVRVASFNKIMWAVFGYALGLMTFWQRN